MGDLNEKKDSEVVDITIDDAEESKQESPKSEEIKTEEIKTEEIKTEETKTEETKAEETKAEETKAETSSDDQEMAAIEQAEALVAEAKSAIEDLKSAVDESKAEIPETQNRHETPEGQKEEPEHQGVYVDEKAFVKARKRHKLLMVVTVTLTALLLIGYTFMVFNSFFYFQPNTIINGVDYSFRSEESVQQEIDSKMSDYQLHISLRNGDVTIRPEDIGLVITTKNDVHNIKEKQNPFLWFVTYFEAPNEAAYEVSYDRNKLDKFLYDAVYFRTSNMISPENPRIVMNNGTPEIRQGNPGTMIDMARFYDVLDSKLMNLDTEFKLDDENCYEKSVYNAESPEVIQYRDTIESYTKLKMTYVFVETKFDITPEQIYCMLDLDTDNFTCSVSRLKVQRFVNDFAFEHNTFGRARDFKTHDGKTAHVSNNYMGWEIDQDAEVSMLYDALFHKHGFERTPELIHEGTIYTADCSDIGNSYVEVDLTYQKVYLYIDGKKILEDDVISGNPNHGSQTPGGLYAIYGMRMNVVLTGPGYASHVDYWMPFNGEIGLHDAYWQSKFGGELYKTRGSHGCVNLPHATAEKIFELGYRGMPVVCYWRTPEFFY